MRKKFSLITFLMLSLHFYTNAANKVQWALTDIPQGYYYQDFHDGMAVCIDTITKRYGAIDSNGDLFISAQYEYLSDFNGDFAIARNVDGDGIIDKEGKYILKPQKYYQITPIEAEVDHIKQKMSNCFLVVNNKDQNQAIFYKDSFITDFTPKHSIELDIKFPFIYTKTGMILNTESGEYVNSLHDMGSYYLTLNEQGELNAISHITGENITSSVIGKYIAYDEAVNYVSSTAGSFVNDAATEAIKASMNETIDKYYCDLSYKDGEWLLATKDGDVKYSLKDKDGWVCRMPFFQNCIIWFERNIPNTDSTQLKIINITGVEICNKKVKGTFTLKFFPKYWHYMGNTMITYSSPHLFITELSSEGKIQKTTLDCIVRGDVFAQSRAMKAGKYSSYTFHDKNFYVFGNFLIHKDGDSKTIIYDIQKDKQIPVTEIINISEDIIFAKDLQGKKSLFKPMKAKHIVWLRFQQLTHLVKI